MIGMGSNIIIIANKEVILTIIINAVLRIRIEAQTDGSNSNISG